jgi:hypothetical protein
MLSHLVRLDGFFAKSYCAVRRLWTRINDYRVPDEVACSDATSRRQRTWCSPGWFMPNIPEENMSARTKINSAVVCGSLAVAALVGAVFNSWLAFGVAAAVLVAASMHDGGIRPARKGRG